MPKGNRVEELEDEVAELKATVQGLTEELVEAHERIRQIEAALGGREEVPAAGESATDGGQAVGADQEEVDRAAVEADKRGGADDEDEAEEDPDDIIVA